MNTVKNRHNYNNHLSKERLNIMRKVLILALVISMSTWAASDTEERLDQLESTVNSVLSKAGIHFGGEFRSQFLNSRISDGSDLANENARKSEGISFTSVDFDITARPNTALGARAMFRMHQDWRNFFGDPSNPIFTRWISVDGSVLNNMIGYSAGHFHKRISPLTVWSPDMEILFEPEVFAQMREIAMGEEFLGNNMRVLPGIDLRADVQLYPIVDRVHLNFFGSRLRSSGTTESTVTHEPAQMDKYALGSNLEIDVNRGLGFGLTYMNIFDNHRSAHGNVRVDTQHTRITVGRANATNALFMPDDLINFGVELEGAFSVDSSYRTSYFANGIRRSKKTEEVFIDDTTSVSVPLPTTEGLAFNANVFGRIDLGNSTFRASGGFLYNEEGFRNDLAQSPSFIGTRPILHSGNNTPELYNIFDAMYRNVFKYASDGTGGYTDRRPVQKLSYTSSILTQDEALRNNIHRHLTEEEINSLNHEGIDSELKASPWGLNPYTQLTLPYGLATPDRQGIKGSFGVSLLDRALQLKSNFHSLKSISRESIEIEEGVVLEFPEVEFIDFQIGGSFDVSSVTNLDRHFIIGATFNHSEAKQPGAHGLEGTSWTNNLVGLDLNWNFFQRFSLLGGMMFLVSDYDYITGEDATETQSILSGGLRYEVTEGGSLTALFTSTNKELKVGDDKSDASFIQPELFLTVSF
ncbi:hypothetical protein QA601_03260 [Chitinispirillales bacterium ANBcel5]|uniref:hypothetical protein n=1 Tax=Cellulosispirillum alkaliphilum TaxID=3039283 RepID=UPI002A56961D|nr:hypothetical protein [Chitinispirillales bacterium ANBcel5]